MRKLKGLYLSKTQITDTGIGYLKNLDQLEQLLLAETKITDKGLEHLAGLSKLKYLNLKKTSVSKTALKTLMQALENCRITHFEMQSLNIPLLIDQLGDKDPMKRSIARNNLRNIGEPAIAALVEALKDKNLDVRMGAAMTLCMMGPKAKDAVGALIDALKGDDKSLRSYASYSLMRIDEPPFPIIMELLKDEEPLIRRAIVENLGDIGSEAVTLLIQALKDKDSLVRNYACWGLGNIGPKAKDAIGPLTLATQDNDKNVRHQAIEALKKINPTVDKSAVQPEIKKNKIERLQTAIDDGNVGEVEKLIEEGADVS
jgi:hypothetical protein